VRVWDDLLYRLEIWKMVYVYVWWLPVRIWDDLLYRLERWERL
jgi:hypothetical protein